MEVNKNMDDYIEIIFEEKTGKKRNNRVKCIKIVVYKSFNDCEILTPIVS
jgi:hypothetical protein